MFNFQTAKKPGSYLKPGIYRLKFSSVSTKKVNDQDVLVVTLANKDDTTKFAADFFLDENGLGRLKYLHEAVTGTDITTNFKTLTELEKYFAGKLLGAKSKTFIIGGRQTGDKVYASLPLVDFIVDDNTLNGEFAEGDENWKKFVYKAKTAATGKKGGLLNDDDDSDSDLPFDDDGDDAPGKKAPAAAASKRGRPAGSSKKENGSNGGGSKTTKTPEPVAAEEDDSEQPEW